MKTMFLLINGQLKCTLADFVEINTENGVCALDQEDLKTIENLQHGESHFIVQDNAFKEVRRVRLYRPYDDNEMIDASIERAYAHPFQTQREMEAYQL